MKLDSNPAVAAALAEVRRGADSRGAVAAAELPREAVNILRQRGIAGGAVLMLADGPRRSRRLEAAS